MKICINCNKIGEGKDFIGDYCSDCFNTEEVQEHIKEQMQEQLEIRRKIKRIKKPKIVCYKDCKKCGKEFLVNKNAKAFCSKDCRKAYKIDYLKQKRTVTNCLNCNKNLVGTTAFKYCPDCRASALKENQIKYVQKKYYKRESAWKSLSEEEKEKYFNKARKEIINNLKDKEEKGEPLGSSGYQRWLRMKKDRLFQKKVKELNRRQLRQDKAELRRKAYGKKKDKKNKKEREKPSKKKEIPKIKDFEFCIICKNTFANLDRHLYKEHGLLRLGGEK